MAFLGVDAYLRAYGCSCRPPRVVNSARYVACADCGIGYRANWRGAPDVNPNGQASCHYCGTWSDETRDHIVPKTLGGPNGRDNVVPACKRCNGAKSEYRSTCNCGKCVKAWEKWGPENYMQTVRVWRTPLYKANYA